MSNRDHFHSSEPAGTPPRGLHRELHVLISAVGFFSRIPVPHSMAHDGSLLDSATRYLPLVGLVVGAMSAAVYWGAALALPVPVAVVLSMGAAVLLTGAFHEDGLTDTADGFGGGWTVERKLEIMKDSRIGTYGAVTLLLSMLLRYSLLVSLAGRASIAEMVSVIVAVHVGARLGPVVVMVALRYVRLDETSKVKPVAKAISPASVLVAVVLATGLTVAAGGVPALLPLAVVPPVAVLCALFFRRHIGGYTGDTLGACEQICELALLTAALVAVSGGA